MDLNFCLISVVLSWFWRVFSLCLGRVEGRIFCVFWKFFFKLVLVEFVGLGKLLLILVKMIFLLSMIKLVFIFGLVMYGFIIMVVFGFGELVCLFDVFLIVIFNLFIFLILVM